jgi:hypothetical protein
LSEPGRIGAPLLRTGSGDEAVAAEFDTAVAVDGDRVFRTASEAGRLLQADLDVDVDVDSDLQRLAGQLDRQDGRPQDFSHIRKIGPDSGRIIPTPFDRLADPARRSSESTVLAFTFQKNIKQ